MVLAWVPKSGEFSPNALFNSPKYQIISEAFKNGEMPWGSICGRCAFNRPEDPPESHLAHRTIAYFQIEPTLACALKCPACTRLRQISTRPGPHMLDLGRIRLLLRSLRAEGYTILNIEFCGQGEPLDHKDFPALLAVVKEFYPKARLRLITNGNHSYTEKVGTAFIDEVMVSIDGASQESYQKYRIGGSLNEALQFAKQAKIAKPQSKVIWKYILFDHNDTPEEIELAERTAEQLNIDQLQFVRTHTAGRSLKWENRTLPLSWINSVDTATPRIVRESLPSTQPLAGP
ncbi:radical SAM protein [Agrobacterium pusense]|uniref:radical SAM protein n=1 Tax=Agrobacterium pusense TaxID=648995 RepID=UPI002FDDE232